MATALSISPPQDDVRAAALNGLNQQRGATDAGGIQAQPPGGPQQAPAPPGTNEVANKLTEVFQLLQRGDPADWEALLQFLGAIEQVTGPVNQQGAGGQQVAPSGQAAPAAAPQGPPLPQGGPPGAGVPPSGQAV